jgi:hypothetical protein
LERFAEEILDRLAIDLHAAQRLGGFDGREAQLQQGVAHVSDSPPSLSRRSSTTRWATFLPTPGTTVSVAASPATTARRIASGRRAERKLSATLGPTPVTPVS